MLLWPTPRPVAVRLQIGRGLAKSSATANIASPSWHCFGSPARRSARRTFTWEKSGPERSRALGASVVVCCPSQICRRASAASCPKSGSANFPFNSSTALSSPIAARALEYVRVYAIVASLPLAAIGFRARSSLVIRQRRKFSAQSRPTTFVSSGNPKRPMALANLKADGGPLWVTPREHLHGDGTRLSCLSATARQAASCLSRVLLAREPRRDLASVAIE